MKTYEIKTCLLVTDDPDDHQAFSEAIGRVSEDSIVVIVVDSEKAQTLLSSATYIPNHLIIDLSMDGLDINMFLETMRSNPKLARIPVLTYGEPSQYADILDRRALVFFAKDYEFSKLQSILHDFIHNQLG
ncbi:MAG TPA: hypothetical protein VGD40_00805 [Chryseosolibacter sp.]